MILAVAIASLMIAIALLVGASIIAEAISKLAGPDSEAINIEVNRIKALRKDLEQTVQNSGDK